MDPKRNWRQQILHRIQSIPKIGVPGTIIAFGDNAEPILTGDRVSELILTASECGNGRIVVFSHNGYIKSGFVKNEEEFRALNANIKKWASKDSYSSENEVLYITPGTPIQGLYDGYKLFVWDCEDRSKDFVHAMLSCIKVQGVGLVMGMCPWGWRQLSHEKPLDQAVFHPVLLEAGVCYTSDYTRSGDGGFYTSNNKAQEAHLGRAVTACSEDCSAFGTYGELIQISLPNLPADVWQALYPKLAKMVGPHSMHNAPCPQNPVSSSLEKMAMLIQLKQFQFGGLEIKKLPGTEIFPGDFPQSPKRGSVQLEMTASFNGERHSTGYYVPAGETLKVTVIKGSKTLCYSILFNYIFF